MQRNKREKWLKGVALHELNRIVAPSKGHSGVVNLFFPHPLWPAIFHSVLANGGKRAQYSIDEI